LALALEDMDGDGGLPVRGRGEYLALSARYRRIAGDKSGKDAAEGLDAEGKRRDVEKEHVLDLAAENAALDRRAYCHRFVGVYALGGLLVEQVPDDRLDLGYARGASDEDDLVGLGGGETCVREGFRARGLGAVEEVVDHSLECRAGQSLLKVLRTRGVRGDERQVDLRLLDVGELDLGLFRRLLEALEGHA